MTADSPLITRGFYCLRKHLPALGRPVSLRNLLCGHLQQNIPNNPATTVLCRTSPLEWTLPTYKVGAFIGVFETKISVAYFPIDLQGCFLLPF